MPTERPNYKRHAPARSPGQASLGLSVAFGALALVGAVVAGFAWSRPTMTSSVVGYTQSVELSYWAHVPAGSVYGPAGLTTGEPVYTSLVKELQLGVAYKFDASAATDLRGTEKVVATIGNGQGITRQFVLGPETTFHGTHFDATAALNLRALEAVAASFAQAAGGSALGSYAVTVSPSVAVKGSVGGSQVAASFDPQWSFTYSSGALVPASGPGGSAAGATAGAGGPSGGTGAGNAAATGQGTSLSWATSSSGSVTVPSAKAATLWFRALKVAFARTGSLVLLAFALVAGAVSGGRVLRDANSEDEAVRIATRHGSSLIEVKSLPDYPSVALVEMASFAGLMQVATRLECPLLYCAGTGNGAPGTYAVVDNTTLYCYRTAGSARTSKVPRPERGAELEAVPAERLSERPVTLVEAGT